MPYIERLIADSATVPAVNQVELHPLLPQERLVSFCRSRGICVTAYSPLGSAGGPLLADAAVKKVADKHGVAAGNVLINWLGPHSPPPRRASKRARSD